MADLRTFSNTSNLMRFKLVSSATGAGLTGLTFSSTGLIISTIADNEATATAYTAAGSTIETIATLGTFATPTATKCRFKEVDAINHPGLYEFQFSDARFSVSSAKRMIVTVPAVSGLSLAQSDYEIQLTQFNPYDAVRLGLTALPNAAAEAAGGLFTRGTGAGQINQDANGRIDANVKTWISGTIPAVNVAGVPLVDLTKIDGLATNGNNATLHLKQLDIQNSAASALIVRCSGGGFAGAVFLGDDMAAGISAYGGANGGVGVIIGNQLGGEALQIDGGVTVYTTTTFTGAVTATDAGNDIRGIKVGSFSAGAITNATFAAGAIDNAAIATDAIGSAELAASAITEIQSGLATAAALANVAAGVAALSGIGGTYAITLTVTDGSNPLQNVAYAVTSGATLIGAGSTDADGEGSITADAGTYTVSLLKGGYTFAPLTRTVTGIQSGTLVNDLVMTAVVPPTPSAPNMCVLTGTLLDGTGAAVAGATGTFRLHTGEGKTRPLSSGGNTITNTTINFVTNDDGEVKEADGTTTLELIRTDDVEDANGDDAEAYWLCTCEDAGLTKRKFYTATANKDISTLANV